MKNFAGIVTFNPNIERLKENVSAITCQVDKLYIVDNNSGNIQEISSLIENNEKVVFIQNGENKGIAYALNVILERSKHDGAVWTLLLDQDSVVPKNIINYYNKYINLEGSGMLCPMIYDNNIGGNLSFKDNVEDVGICLTSGSYVNVSVWDSIGKFREELFIDSVDTEYSIRLFFKGYKTYRINEVVLNHELGNSQKKLFKSITNHNCTRRYYIARNSILVAKYYKRLLDRMRVSRKEKNELMVFFDWHISPLRTYLRQFQFILLVSLYEKNKISKIRSIICGLADGRKMHLKEL